MDSLNFTLGAKGEGTGGSRNDARNMYVVTIDPRVMIFDVECCSKLGVEVFYSSIIKWQRSMI